MKLKKLLCMALVLALLVTFGACDGPKPEVTPPTETAATTAPIPPAVEGDGEVSPTAEIIENPADNPIIYFSMSLGEDDAHIRYLLAYEDFGETYLEYVGEEKKVGRFGVSLLHRLTEAVEEAGIATLNGCSEYGKGERVGSLYISYADGTCLMADFSGVIPGEFADAYGQMDTWFAEQTAHLSVYDPQPTILGDVNVRIQEEMLAILEMSGIRELEQMVISDIPMDDYFVLTAGLTSKEGIAGGASCSAMMMSTPYSFVIVAAREESYVEAIREDFRDSLDWQKWVCVMPTDALIAQKGNLVLCLMGTDVLYELTRTGMESTGWTEIETFPNPEL